MILSEKLMQKKRVDTKQKEVSRKNSKNMITMLVIYINAYLLHKDIN